MNQQTISQKFRPINNQLVETFFAANEVLEREHSQNIIHRHSPKHLTLQGIKYLQLEDTINGFAKLQTNWDSYNAGSISNDAIIKAIETLNHLYSKGLLSNTFNVSVFPMRDGGIQFEFDGENLCAELEINYNGESGYLLFDDDSNIKVKWNLFELSELSTLLEEAQYA